MKKCNEYISKIISLSPELLTSPLPHQVQQWIANFLTATFFGIFQAQSGPKKHYLQYQSHSITEKVKQNSRKIVFHIKLE